MKKKPIKQRLSEGWTLRDVQEVANYYDNQSDAEGAAETESSNVEETFMAIPWKLVPRVRKLLKEHESKSKSPRRKSPSAA